VNKFFLNLFFLILLTNCSLGEKEDFIEKDKKSEILFKKNYPIVKELNPNLKILLKKITKRKPFLHNNTNNSGNINFETDFQKIYSYKFSTIDNFEFTQPELIFTADNSLIFFDGKGTIFKINENLKEEWKVNYYKKKEKKLDPILYFAHDDENLIIADTLSKYYSINLKNGELNWSKDNLSPFNSNIKIFKDKFIAVDFDNVIRCFSVRNGEELWNFKTENLFIKSQKKLSLVLDKEFVYFINSLGDVTSLYLNDGTLFWQTPTQSNVIYQNAFSLENSDLVFANNSIYFSNNKNEIFSIDSMSGIIKWKQTLNSNLRPTIIENLIFSISEEGYLFIIDDKTGNIIRITNVLNNIKDKKNNIKPIGFIIAKNKIYLSLNNGNLLKINISTAVQENIFKLHRSKISRPYVFNKNLYLIKKNAIIKSN
tara:strand:+ start:473 stop:1753 length:1281 start_codon:yes stop_codon:yes gene_type:complete